MSSMTAPFKEVALRHLFRIVNGATPDSKNSEFWDGDVPWITPEDLSNRTSVDISETKRTLTEAGYESCGTTMVPSGSIVLSTRAPIGNLAISKRNMCTNQGCKSLVPLVDTCARFFFYQLSVLTAQLNRRGSGTTFLELSSSELASFKVHAPGPDKQQQIANFLDEKTARIDALITEKERLVETLNEYWRSISVDIVLGTENASLEFQETGIPWIEKIPKHWGLRPVKTLFKLVTEQSPDDHGLELLSLYTGIGVRPRKDLEQKGNRASNTDGYWIVQENDLVVNKLLAWMGAIAASAYSGVTSPAYDILRPTAELNTWYYDALFRCGIYLTEFKSKSRGIMDMRLRLYFEELGTVYVPYPPKAEQDQIVQKLSEKRQRIDSLVEHCSTHIARLREYRSSMISAAVTGQLDITNYETEAV